MMKVLFLNSTCCFFNLTFLIIGKVKVLPGFKLLSADQNYLSKSIFLKSVSFSAIFL